MKTKTGLEKEFKYYLDNKDKLIKKYLNRFLVIKDEKVAGDYGSEIEAIEEGKKRFIPGTFLIQHCTEEESSYRQTFHSGALFINE